MILYTNPFSDPKSNKVEPRNKFKDPVSPLLPHAIRAWAEASTLVGRDFNHAQPARPGVLRGYVLPEPALFVTQKDDTMQEYLRMYLKLQAALMHRITKHGAIGSVQGTNQWRALLGLTVHGGTRNDSRAARNRHVMAKELRKVNEDQTSGFVSGLVSQPSYLLIVYNRILIFQTSDLWLRHGMAKKCLVGFPTM